MTATPQSADRPAGSWPRRGIWRDNQGGWMVPSASVPGAWRHVTWATDEHARLFFACSCPRGMSAGRMGSHHEPPCRHVLAVSAAEADDGTPARPPAARVNVSALVD